MRSAICLAALAAASEASTSEPFPDGAFLAFTVASQVEGYNLPTYSWGTTSWPAGATALVAGASFSGTTALWVTAAYNGTPATLPGPWSTVCQWNATALGPTTTVVIAPGSPCYDALPPNPVFTLAATTASLIDSGLSAVQIVSSALAADTCDDDQPCAFSVGTICAAAPLDLAAAVSLVPTPAPPTAAGLLLRRSRHVGGDYDREDSFVLSVSPLGGDGGVAAFVVPMVPGLPPPSCRWASDGSLSCDNWYWSVNGTAGGGALFVDVADPCNPAALSAVNAGSPVTVSGNCNSDVVTLVDNL